MSLDSNKLANELLNLDGKDETSVIDSFTAAWLNYFYQCSINGVSATPGTIDPSSMKSSLVGIILKDNGVVAIQKGLTAFWTTIVSSGISIWITAPNTIVSIVPPTTLSTLSTSLQSVFSSNVSLKLDKNTSVLNIADVLHSNAGIGSVVTLQPPGSSPTIASTIT